MTISYESIITAINNELTVNTSFTTKDHALLAQLINAVESNQINKVASHVNLPLAYKNKGRFFFIDDTKSIHYSNGIEWTNFVLNSAQTKFNSGWYLHYKDPTLLTTTLTNDICGKILYSGVRNPISFCNSSQSVLIVRSDRMLEFHYNNTAEIFPFKNNFYFYTGSWNFVSCSNNNVIAAIKTDGTLWTWGANNYGELGDGTTTARSSPGTTAGGGTTWSQISCGNGHVAAVKTDGTLWTWGENSTGKLGDGSITSRSSPGTTAGGGTTWSQVSCGDGHVAAIKTDGTLWTWGDNTEGQMGDGTTTARSSPGTTAGGGTTWSQVSCIYNSVLAIKTDGTLWVWGANGGQLGDGTFMPKSSPITPTIGGNNWKKISGYYALDCNNNLYTSEPIGDARYDETLSFKQLPGKWADINYGFTFLGTKQVGLI